MSTFFAKVYAPPDSGNALLISAKLIAVITAITPFSANASIAAGPVARNATPASTRMPPPTMAPIPTAVAPSNPMLRSGVAELPAGESLMRRAR